jgi:FkbM family methyltransferase
MTAIHLLKKLKSQYECDFDIILDVGAHVGEWTRDCLEIFPTSTYYLFEPTKYNSLIELDLSTENVNVHYLILNEKEVEVDWYSKDCTGDSMFREKSHHYVGTEPCKKPSYPLDDVLGQLELEETSRIFMKMDTQGSEIPILKGATRILKNVDFILMEVPFFGQYNEGVPTFNEHVQFMDSIDFIPFEMVQTHFFHEFMIQMDIVFIRKSHRLNTTVQQRMMMTGA